MKSLSLTLKWINLRQADRSFVTEKYLKFLKRKQWIRNIFCSQISFQSNQVVTSVKNKAHLGDTTLKYIKTRNENRNTIAGPDEIIGMFDIEKVTERIYGNMQQRWNIVLTKKTAANECELYPTIRLMSDVTKTDN